jgi:hypothetical protein
MSICVATVPELGVDSCLNMSLPPGSGGRDGRYPPLYPQFPGQHQMGISWLKSQWALGGWGSRCEGFRPNFREEGVGVQVDCQEYFNTFECFEHDLTVCVMERR